MRKQGRSTKFPDTSGRGHWFKSGTAHDIFEILSSAESKTGARLLRFCPISAGHGVGIPASTQGVPARRACVPAAGILAADGALFIRRSISNDRSGAAPAGQRAAADAVRSAEDGRR